MEETTPDEDQNQENSSIWKQLKDSAKEESGNVWKQLAASAQEPADLAAQRAKFVAQEGAKLDPARAAEVVRMSKQFGLSEQEVGLGFDRLKAAVKANNPEWQVINPKLRDALTESPNYSAATEQHLPALKQLDLYYNRPAGLRPDFEGAKEKAKEIAHLRAERDWAQNPQNLDYSRMASVAGGSMPPVTMPTHYASKDAMEAAYYQQELEKRQNIEKLMAGFGEMDLPEIMTAKFPESTGLNTFTALLPYARIGPNLGKTISVSEARSRVADGTADEIEKDAVEQANRIAAIQKLRGTGFVSGLAEQGLALPATVMEMGAGGTLGRATTGALGLSKAAAFFAEPTVGAATTGSPEGIESYLQHRADGDSAPAALAKAGRDAFASYFGAHLFGPWFMKAAPAEQALVKESLAKSIQIEALKLPAMNIASELIKTIGPSIGEDFQQTEIYRAAHGDTAAIKSLIQQAIVGGVIGGIHTAKRNSGIDKLTKAAQDFADDSLHRAEQLHSGLSEQIPDLSREVTDKLAYDSPNEFTYIPVQAFDQHYGDQARAKVAEMGIDPAKYDNAKAAGSDLVVPTSMYDHTIGADEGARKFFANEIRPEPGAINLREARALEKAYNAGVRLPIDLNEGKLYGQENGYITDAAQQHAARMLNDIQSGETLVESDGQKWLVERNKKGGGFLIALDENGKHTGIVYDLENKDALNVIARSRRQSGLGSTPRQRAIQHILEQAKGNKVDEAVGRAEIERGDDKQFFSTLGLSDQQMANIGQTLGKAREYARQQINDKEIERRDKLKSSLYEKDRQRTEADVTKEVDARPEQVAIARLQKHELPNGTPLPEDLPRIKLSKEGLQEQFPGLMEKSFPKGVVADGNFADGAHVMALSPEDAAQMLGFNNGNDLVKALTGANREQAIKLETDSRMAQKYPLGLQPQELPEAAERALHNKHSAELQRKVLEYIVENKLNQRDQMVKAALRKVPPSGEITEAANRDIRDNYNPATLDPSLFLAAEQKAKREALAAALSGKWEDVFDRKLEELNAHERYRAAVDAIDMTKDFVKEAVELPDKPYLNKGTTGDWNQQIKDLLRRVGLIAVDPKDLAGMKPFNDWAQDKMNAGQTRLESLRIDPQFANPEYTKAFRDLSFGQIESMRDTLDQLKHLAKDIDTVNTAAGKVEREAILRAFVANVEENFKKLPARTLTDENRTRFEKLKSWAKKFDASLERPEAFLNRLDGGKIDGPMNQLFQGQVQARVRFHELKQRFSEALGKAIDEMPKELQRRLDDRIYVEGMKIPTTLREIMAIAANGGNESNYSKMLRGELERARQGQDSGLVSLNPDGTINDSVLQRAVGQLPEQAKDFVQKMLDITNSFWPEIDEMERWAKGKPPVKIEAKQMLKEMGDRAGGYYPAMYDRNFSKAGELQISGDIGELLEKSYRSATTDAGYRQSRVEEFAAPMDFNFNRLASHMDGMAKDLAFRKWLLDANKIISSPEMNQTLQNYLGPEYRTYIRDWIKRVVGADGHSTDVSGSAFQKFMSAARHNVTVATLALKPAVFLHHALGFGPAISEVGAGNFARNYIDFLNNMKTRYRQVIEESPEMAHYLETSDANIRQSLEKLGDKKGWFADVQRFGMKIIPWGNMLRAIPTYMAAKEMAIKELSARGISGAELDRLAIQKAEQTVRLTSGGGNAGDVPAIMKSDGMKLLLMFYTPGSVLYSRLKAAGLDAKSGNFQKALASAFWLIPFSAAMHAMTSGRIPDEDKDETYPSMVMDDTITYPFSALPLGNDLAKNMVNAINGKEVDFSVSSPLLNALEKAFKSVKKGADWFQDEAEFEDVAREMFKTSGYFFGAPTEQTEISVGYLADLMRGKTDPNDMLEFFHDALWRRPPSRR